ncbi:MAG TPA: hypothetical protein VFK29_09765 [Rhodanobacteraceae bacterium]|jgi:hypothetical protein|nr:hypothetical protein [Rhodanobacteraceae bacterium]
MKITHTLVALALAAACGQTLASAPAFKVSPGNLPPLGADRIVGLWHVAVTLGPCAGGPTHSFIALNTFHAGGTLSSTDNSPPPANGPAQGIWQYLGHGEYQTHMQFYRFLPDGTYDGLQDIYQDTVVDWRGQTYVTTIDARVLNTDGSLRAEVCGTGQGTRVPMDSNP